MSDLGRRYKVKSKTSVKATPINTEEMYNNCLNLTIQTAIEKKLIPNDFSKLIGNNFDQNKWQELLAKNKKFSFTLPTNQEASEFARLIDIRRFNNMPYELQTGNIETARRIVSVGFMNIVARYAPKAYYSLILGFKYSLSAMNFTENEKQLFKQYFNVNIPTNTNGLTGGTPPDKDKTWVKPLVVTAIIGTAVGVGLWKKDEIMKAITGKKTAVNGLNGAKRKRKTNKKGLGSKPNAGLKKMLAINKSAKSLQHQSGYEMRNVKEVEVKVVRKSMPKLRWKEAQKRAKNLYK